MEKLLANDLIMPRIAENCIPTTTTVNRPNLMAMAKREEEEMKSQTISNRQTLNVSVFSELLADTGIRRHVFHSMYRARVN